jgi:molybdopterin-guanine dinucleotide biosynthesis protein MobB
VLAVCGWRGAGKTTLLEGVIPELVRRGLTVAAIKHHTHSGALSVDQPGKDSDRLFRAGADVHLRAPAEAFEWTHRTDDDELAAVLSGLLEGHDLVLVEGHKDTPLPKVWLSSEHEQGPPEDVAGVLAVLPRDSDRPRRFQELLDEWLPRAWSAIPVYGGVLVGGAGTRIGHPKQLLPHSGGTFLEAVVAAIHPILPHVVLLGRGAIPAACERLPRLADAPGLAGPLAGMLAALRWAPGHAWLFAACDLPMLSPEAVTWLVGQRRPGRWAVLPDCGKGVEPLLALYEPQVREPLQRLAADPEAGPRLLERHPKVHVLAPPAALRDCWRNINTPADLAALGEDPRTP